jgi:hypothetical protein
MANLGGTFDATLVDPNAPFEVIPPGDYEVQITASSMESNKAGTGSYLKLELEIMDGPQAGRKLFDRLNLDNPNAKAVEIAQRTLSAICHAVGVLSVTDSEELHLRPMIAKVKVVPRSDQPGELSNEIGGYKPVGGSAAAPAQKAKAAPTPAPTQTGSAPWKRNAA